MDNPVFQYKGLVFDFAEEEYKTLHEFLSISAEKLVEEHTIYSNYHNDLQKSYHPAYLDSMYLVEGDYIDVYIEGLSKYGRAFPKILLYSIIIMAWASFESNIKLIYKVMNHFKESQLEWDQVKGNVINKTKRLLNDIDLHVDGESETIAKFKNYNMVRNCIVHNNGEIQEFKYCDKLLSYATEKGIISDGFDEPELELNREYCNDVLNTFEFFFAHLSINYMSR